MMRFNSYDSILHTADRIVRLAGTRDADAIAEALGIEIINVPFSKQKGIYKVIERSRFIFIKEDLDDVTRGIVLLHEAGHDRLHRRIAAEFREFNIFDMRGSKMEYEANLFAAHIMLPDEEVIEYIKSGCSADRIAGEMRSDINLVAIKAADLARRGWSFRVPEHADDFLK